MPSKRTTGDTDALTERVRLRRVKAQACTGNPNNCKGKPWHTQSDPATPLCGIDGAECDRRKDTEKGAVAS